MNRVKEVFICSDQPTVCPKCGLRTVIFKVELSVVSEVQEHCCPNIKCGFEFLVQSDYEFNAEIRL